MEVACQCGNVQFTCPLPEPTHIFVCHCTQCRQQSGSAFGISAIFPAFTIQPRHECDLRKWSRVTQFGETKDCYFCGNCGIRLLHATSGHDEVSVKGGCMKGLTREMMAKAKHIWTQEAVIPIPEGVDSCLEEPPEWHKDKTSAKDSGRREEADGASLPMSELSRSSDFLAWESVRRSDIVLANRKQGMGVRNFTEGDIFSILQSEFRLMEREGPFGVCKACSRMLKHDRESPIHHNRKGLEFSANRGCTICCFLKEYTPLSWAGTRNAEVEVRQGLLLYRQPSSSGGRTTAFEIYPTAGKELLAPDWVVSRTLCLEPITESSIELIKTWVSSCDTDHESCVRASDMKAPTRLIDVTRIDPCLVDFKESIPERGTSDIRYIALSHCWGSSKQTLATRRTNIAAHKQRIPLRDLPLLFRDAIFVTRKLGIPFLWIDSLCILQDSSEDWSTECLNMGQYYKNAWLTMSALEAAGSSESFLKQRVQPSSICLDGVLSLRTRLPAKSDIFRKAALNHRGWALQERLLSTRILHFTEYGVFWECQTCSAQETSTVKHYGKVDWADLVTAEGPDFKRMLSPSEPVAVSSEEAFTLWRYIIRQASMRSLTYPNDRLPSLSGLAALVAEHTKSEYLAGIWRDNLTQLVWTPDRKTDECKECTASSSACRFRSDGYGPSWSWASVRGHVKYDLIGSKDVFQDDKPTLIEHDIPVTVTSSFGYVTAGCVTLRAKAIDVQLSGPRYYYGSKSANECVVVPVAEIASDNTNDSSDIDVNTSFTGLLDCSSLHPMSSRMKAIRIVERENKVERRAYYLLVRPQSSNGSSWRRVGVASITRNLTRHRYDNLREASSEASTIDIFDAGTWEVIKLT